MIDSNGNQGPVQHGPAEFQVGQQEPHRVRVEVDETGKVNVYVDDKLVEANLFAALRSRISVVVVVFMLTVATLVSAAALILLR